MSSSQSGSINDEAKKKILDEEKDKRIASVNNEIRSCLKTTIVRMMAPTNVSFAMDSALGINRKGLIIKIMSELIDEMEKEEKDG